MKIRWKIAQTLELLWWRKYLHKKDKNAYLIWKRNYWADFLMEIQEFYQLKPTDVLLDLGCGPAGIFIQFPNNEVDAIDPLIEKYEENLIHFSKIDYPKTNFITQNIEDVVSNKKYAAIFCINVINHVDDIQKAVKNIHSLANSETKIILSIDCHQSNFWQKIFALIPGDILHPHQYTLAGYKNLFQQQGLKINFEKKLNSDLFFDYWVLGLEKI